MSARTIDREGVFPGVKVQTRTTQLTLPTNAVCIRKNGIEFLSPTQIAPWTEMTVDLQSPQAAKKVHCTGVVVACTGNRHTGYNISVLFTGLSRQSQEQLNLLAYS